MYPSEKRSCRWFAFCWIDLYRKHRTRLTALVQLSNVRGLVRSCHLLDGSQEACAVWWNRLFKDHDGALHPVVRGLSLPSFPVRTTSSSLVHFSGTVAKNHDSETSG